jgi:tetratricopeptide (TPR) repeat protein
MDSLTRNFTNSSSLNIDTKPSKATVYKYEKRSKTFVKLGVTPLEIKAEELDEIKDVVALKVEKEGYVVEHLVYDKNNRENVDYLISLKAVETWSDKDAEVSSKLAGAIAQKVQTINSLVLRKRLKEALTLVQKLIDQYPKAFTFYDIKGSICILKGDKRQGIASLKKSLSLNPENIETEKLLKVLERK